MGQFSWLDCKDGTQIVDDKMVDVYVLVPQEFGGGHIVEHCYDGYGDFGGHDIYDLVADWNKETISHHNLRDVIATHWMNSDIEYYMNALKRQVDTCQKLIDFKSLSDEEMKEKYGDDFKRIIGIDIACYDEQNAALKYPIKITHDANAVYENCKPSDSDPNQGWEYDDDDDEWY